MAKDVKQENLEVSRKGNKDKVRKQKRGRKGPALETYQIALPINQVSDSR